MKSGTCLIKPFVLEECQACHNPNGNRRAFSLALHFNCKDVGVEKESINIDWGDEERALRTRTTITIDDAIKLYRFLTERLQGKL